MAWRWMMTATLGVLLAGPATAHPAPRWVPAWMASATPDRLDGGADTPLHFADETVRQDMRLGSAAVALRVRISNELGTAPLTIGAGTARLLGGAGAAQPLRFDGRASVTVPPGGVLLSDPVPLRAPALGEVAVSLYFPTPARPAVRRTALRVVKGQAEVPDSKALAYRQNVISALYVQPPHPRQTVVVALGDSITEGATATRGANADWPALLARRLEQRCPGSVVVLNAGISGNKLLDDGRSPSALARLDRDVLALPGVDQVILFEGINDIRHSGPPDAIAGRNAADMVLGYRQIVTRLQQHGIAVIGATLTPFGNSDRYEPVAAATRQALNGFIRDGQAFDAVIDFDAALRDPARPEWLPAALTRDFLHPNDTGYQRMAASVDLSLFCKAR